MTTEKQTKANKENALLSTGAKTEEGKLVVSKNAVKHGLFTKDLIIQAGDGKEDPKEYQEILVNLVECLEPKDQMESLLVEKIAVDFWRLRRVIRFETGSIRNFLDTVIEKYYTPRENDFSEKKTPKTALKINEEIAQKKSWMGWNNSFLKCLKKGMVNFDKPEWNGADLEADIESDLILILDEVGDDVFTESQKSRYDEGGFSFDEMKTVLAEHDYTDKKLAEILIPLYEKQNQEYQEEIEALERQKKNNALAEEVQVKVHSLPTGEHAADKVMRYERSLQKSIFQNLAILKRLQAERPKG
jgi:hypothetical protein